MDVTPWAGCALIFRQAALTPTCVRNGFDHVIDALEARAQGCTSLLDTTSPGKILEDEGNGVSCAAKDNPLWAKLLQQGQGGAVGFGVIQHVAKDLQACKMQESVLKNCIAYNFYT